MIKMDELNKELCRVMNIYCVDSMCETPDYILADYLCQCLLSLKYTNEKRDRWYGFDKKIAGVKELQEQAHAELFNTPGVFATSLASDEKI